VSTHPPGEAPRPVTVEKLIVALAWVADDEGESIEEADRWAGMILRAWRAVEAGPPRRRPDPVLRLVLDEPGPPEPAAT
jgi:hypothetical protein